MANVAGAAVVTTTGAALADAIATQIEAGWNAIRDFMSLITSGIQSFFSAPWIIIPLILIFGISAFWMPYHHVALEVVQAVHTDIIRPLATQVLLPVAETLAPAYEKFVAWWNFGNMIIRKFVLEMALIPLRCEYTPTFLRTMLRSILPLCRTGILLLKMTGDTIVGRSTDQEVPKLVVGLSFGAFANMTDAVAGLSGCYCGIIPYYLDFAVMFLNTDSVRCTASNSLAIYQEWIALYVRFYLRLFSYLLDALKWFICRVFGSIFQTGTSECTVEDFPLPNIPRLIPDIDILVDEIEAFVCCLADAVDDIANAAIDTGVDIANTIQLFPGRTLESIDYWKFTTVMKASAPSILEFIRTYYTVGTEVVTLSFNFSKVDKEKSRAAATFMCDELTRGAMSFQLPYTEWQGLQHVMAASYAPYVIPTFIGPGQEATFIYGPRFLNHSCLALVSLQRAVFGMLVNVRSYEDYKTGHYFDCFLREVRDAAVVAAEDSAELFSLLPAWRSCTVVPTVHDEDGMPKLLGFPTVRCPESAFHEELGQIMAAPIAITSATLDYLASVSEHLDDIDAARRVSSGCIFDALDDAVDSSTKTLAVALDQLPNTVADTKLMINITGNFTEELMLWIIPRIGTLTGKFTPDHSLSLQDALNAVEGTQEFIDFIVEKLDKIPFQERTVVDPILGVRPFGIYDFLPVIFSVRTIPPLMRDVGKMLVEMVRFLADTIHTANFNASYANTFDPDNFERLVTAQSALAHSLSESVFGPICSIKQVLHDEYDAGTTPSNCKWRIRWDAADFTVCPIELIPCPEEALAHMGLALARIADLPFKTLLYPKAALRELLDPAICELETAMAEFEDGLAGWDFTANDIPFWHTSLEINIPGVLSGAGFAGAKLLRFGNKLIVALLQQITPRTYAHMPECTTDAEPTRVLYGTGYECTKCIYQSEPDFRCPSGFLCCGDGKCADSCFTPSELIPSIDDAAGAFVSFADRLTTPVAAIDPLMSEAAQAAGRIPAQIVHKLFRFLFTKYMEPIEDFENTMPPLVCAADSAVEAIGKLGGVSISVIGRIVGAFAEISGNDNLAEKARLRTGELATAISALIEAPGDVLVETAGLGFHVAGMILDAKQFSSFTDWIRGAMAYMCRLSDAVAKIPMAVANFIRALDVTGNDMLCEFGQLLGSIINIINVFVQQMIRLVNGIIEEPTIGKGFDVDMVIKSIRLVIANFGSVISFLLELLIKVIQIPMTSTLHNLFESIGLLVSAVLNQVLSVIDGVATFFVLVLEKVNLTNFICKTGADSFGIIKPFLDALALTFEAVGDVFDVFSTSLGKIFHQISSLITNFLADPNSLFARLIKGLFDLFFAFVSMVVSIATGDFSDGVSAFVDELWSFIQLVLDLIIDTIVTLVDNILFGGAGVMECLIDIFDCIGDAIADAFTGAPRDVAEDDVLVIGKLSKKIVAFAYMFPESDSCRESYKALARIRSEYEDALLASGETEETVRPPRVGIFLKWQIATCKQRFDDMDYLEAYMETADLTEEAAAKMAEARSSKQRSRQAAAEAAQMEDEPGLRAAGAPDEICGRKQFGDYGAVLTGDSVCLADAATRVASRIKTLMGDISESLSGKKIGSEDGEGQTPTHARSFVRAQRSAELATLFWNMAGNLSQSGHDAVIAAMAAANGGDTIAAENVLTQVSEVATVFARIAWFAAVDAFNGSETGRSDAEYERYIAGRDMPSGETTSQSKSDTDRRIHDLNMLVWYLKGADPKYQDAYEIVVARDIDSEPLPSLIEEQDAAGSLIVSRDIVPRASTSSNDDEDVCGHTIASALGVLGFLEDSGSARTGGPLACPASCPNCTDPAVFIAVPALCPIESCPNILERFPQMQGICSKTCANSGISAKSLSIYGDEYGYRPWTELFSFGRSSNTLLSGLCTRVFFTDVPTIESEAWLMLADDCVLWELMRMGSCSGTGFSSIYVDLLLDEDRMNAYYDNNTVDGPLTPSDTCMDIGRYGHPTQSLCDAKCDEYNPNSLLSRINVRDASLGLEYNANGNPFFYTFTEAARVVTKMCAVMCTSYDRACRTNVRILDCQKDALSTTACLHTCDLAWPAPKQSVTSLQYLHAECDRYIGYSRLPDICYHLDEINITDVTFDPNLVNLGRCRPKAMECTKPIVGASGVAPPIYKSCECPTEWLDTEDDWYEEEYGKKTEDICRCSYGRIGKPTAIDAPSTTWLPFGCPDPFRSTSFTWLTNIDYKQLSLDFRPKIDRGFPVNASREITSILDMATIEEAALAAFVPGPNKTFVSLWGKMSENDVTPTIYGTNCTNTTATIEFPIPGSDTECRGVPHTCEIVEECGWVDVKQYVAVKHVYTDFRALADTEASWLYDVSVTKTFTSADCVVPEYGLCSSDYCTEGSTMYDAESVPGQTCNPPQHCALGTWCPTDEPCASSGLVSARGTGIYRGNFTFAQHIADEIVETAPLQVWICRNATRCRSVDWCTHRTVYPDSTSPICRMSYSAATYVGYNEDHLRTWDMEFDAPICHFHPTAPGCSPKTAIACLNITDACENVSLCTTMYTCTDSNHNCSIGTGDCQYCYRSHARQASCDRNCGKLRVCATRLVCPGNTSFEYDVCTTGGTLVGCKNTSRPLDHATVTVSDVIRATCESVPEVATGYPRPVPFVLPNQNDGPYSGRYNVTTTVLVNVTTWSNATNTTNTTMVPTIVVVVMLSDGVVVLPITFDAIEPITCNNALVHTGDLCSYLCYNEVDNTVDCLKMIQQEHNNIIGLPCDEYLDDTIVPPTALGSARAKKWYCEQLAIFPTVGPEVFPMSSTTGSVPSTWASKISSYVPLTDATSCENSKRYPCVMMAPTSDDNSIAGRLTDRECKLLETYVENSIMPDFLMMIQIMSGLAEDGTKTRADYPNSTLPSSFAWKSNMNLEKFVEVGGYVGYYEGIGESTGIDVYTRYDLATTSVRNVRDAHSQQPEEEKSEPERASGKPTFVFTDKIGGVDGQLIESIQDLSAEAGDITPDEWLALVRATYAQIGTEMDLRGDPSVVSRRAADAEFVARAVLLAGGDTRAIAARSEGAECPPPANNEQCAPLVCDITPLDPQVCTDYPIEGELSHTCVPRALTCDLVMMNPCETWLLPYTDVIDDPVASYEEYAATDDSGIIRSVGKDDYHPGDETNELAGVGRKIWTLREMFSQIAQDPDGEPTKWGQAVSLAIRTVEAATCASMSWSTACDRLGIATARVNGMSTRGARLVIPNVPHRGARSYTEAARIARESLSWLPPASEMDRTCFVLWYDYLHLARRSCLAQADGVDGPITNVIMEAQNLMREIATYTGLGHGTNNMLDWEDIIPDLRRIRVSRAGYEANFTANTQPIRWGQDSTIVKKVKILLARLAGEILGIPVNPNLDGDDLVITTLASILGFDSKEELINKTTKFVTEFNINPDSGDVGALFWFLYVTPFGASCAGLNGTYELWGIPAYNPLWFPLLPVSGGNFSIKVAKHIVDIEWVVPESMVLDPDDCPGSTDFCFTPWTDTCPCSPLFENCGDRLGFQSPLDTGYFLLNWVIPKAPTMRLFRLFAKFTFTEPWLLEWTNVTTSADFSDKRYCFFVAGIPSSLWLVVPIPLLLIIAAFLIKTGILWLKFLAILIFSIIVFLAFIPVAGEVIYLWTGAEMAPY